MFRRLRKPLLWSLGVSLGLVVLLSATLLVAVQLIDTPKVRARLTEVLSTLLHGQVDWQQLEVRLLPLPHAVVLGLHVAIPEVVTVEVATADVKIRLLPLLRGNVELQAIILAQPSVEVWIARSTTGTTTEAEATTGTNPLELYRNAMRPVLDVVARFAPDTTVAVEAGRVVLNLFSLPPFETNQLDLRIVTDEKGAAVDASATGTYWDSLAIKGRVEFADLRAVVELDGAGLKPQPALEKLFAGIRESLILADVGTSLAVRTDGHTEIDIAFDLDLPKAALQRQGKQLNIEQVRLAGTAKLIENAIDVAFRRVQLGELVPDAAMTLKLSGPKRSPALDVAIAELDLSRLASAVLTLAGDQPAIREYVSRIKGGKVSALSFSTQAESFAELFALTRLHGSAQLSDVSVQLPLLEREATNVAARATLASGVINVSDVSIQLGASHLRQAAVDIILLDPMRLEGTRGLASIVLHDLLPGLRTREPFAGFLRPVPTLSGIAEINVRDLALRFEQPDQAVFDISVTPKRLRVVTDKLPEPAVVEGGTVRATSKSIKVDRLGIAVLDSKASVSGEITDFKGGSPQVTARVADGIAGRQFIDWIWLRAPLDERLKPATPLRFAAPRVQWGKEVLDVEADVSVNAGPSLSVDLSAADKAFTLHRATIKDVDSNANISFAMRDSLLEVDFAGALAARSLARIFGRAADDYPGSISGDMQATIDLKRHDRDSVQGQLAGERFNLLELTGMPVTLEKVELQGEGSVLQIRELALDWAQQKATIRGVVERSENGLATRLEIDSPGIVMDALTSPSAEQPGGESSDSRNSEEDPFDLWSLPLNGVVSLRSGFVEYRGHRVQGVRALATLEPGKASVVLSEATLCGVAFPLSLRVTPAEFEAGLNVTARDQTIETVVQCLAGKHVDVTGNLNMSVVLTARGPTGQIDRLLSDHLAGSVDLRTENGVIRKMALLGNIMSLKSVKELLQGDVGLGGDGFEYRSITVGARIENGVMTFDQAALDSSALGIAATGTVDLESIDSDLTVLVAPFGTLDRVVRNTPVLGYVLGGALTSLPVRVSGDLRDPMVVPLGARAVGSEVRGVFERTFKLPGKLVEPLGAKQGD